MESKKFGPKHVLRIDKGEELVESLTKYCHQNDIRLGSITGLGATNKVKICSIYLNTLRKKKKIIRNRVSNNLVSFISYCLNPNHYHFILRQESDSGIAKFMHRLGLGYTKYFNEKNNRTGVLFQGKYKAIQVDTNEYLLYLSAYVNLNYKIHKLRNRVSKSSWYEYLQDNKKFRNSFCDKRIILSQFKNQNEYKQYAEKTVREIKKKRSEDKLFLETGFRNRVSQKI